MNLRTCLRVGGRAALALMAFTAGATSTTKVMARDLSEELNVAGTHRTYSVHVPDRAPSVGGMPVILVFHGGGMQGKAMRRLTGMDALADSHSFIAVYPDGIDKHWNDGRSTIRNPQDDVGFVSALLDRLERDHPVDRRRIYATGLSNGALFAERLGCDLSGRIAGIAPVAGTIPADIASSCRPDKPVAVLQIDGTADPIMPFEGGNVADFGGRGEGGRVLSVQQTMDFWARHDGCASAATRTPLPPVAPTDRTRVVRTRYAGCATGSAVTLYTVMGGGHAWPGGMQYARPILIGLVSGQIDASRTIVNFFLSLPGVH